MKSKLEKNTMWGMSSNSKAGFTLIEMMVVIGIITILTTMTLVYSRSGSEQLKLFKDEAVVEGVLNQARSLAAERFNKDPNACAFGVHFTAGSQSFILFQDLKSSDKPSCKDFNGNVYNNFKYDSGESFQSLSLENGLVFGISSNSTAVPAGNSVDVVFVPPELSVTSTLPLPLVFTISDPAAGASTTIAINGAGQISAQ